MRISHIVAMTPDRVIGRDNDLPWNHPEDLAYFKRVTMGKPIMMGRKTHESIGRPLPGRENIILTRRLLYDAEGCTVARSVDEAIAQAESQDAEELMIIGGAEIYRATLPETNRIYLTRILATYQGDTHYPELDPDEWEEQPVEQTDHIEWVILDRKS